jgi:hypothetical protein
MARLRLTIAGQTFIAETHPDAPQTVAAFLKLLPYRQKAIHVRWSGEAIWAPLGDLEFGVPAENATSYPAPGQMLLYPGGISETELILAYGPVRFASKAGQLAGTPFLAVTSGLDQLAELGRLTLWKGAQTLRMTLLDSV